MCAGRVQVQNNDGSPSIPQQLGSIANLTILTGLECSGSNPQTLTCDTTTVGAPSGPTAPTVRASFTLSGTLDDYLSLIHI